MLIKTGNRVHGQVKKAKNKMDVQNEDSCWCKLRAVLQPVHQLYGKKVHICQDDYCVPVLKMKTLLIHPLA